jgi:glycosyltransferase involved in cell wall biosynthesis
MTRVLVIRAGLLDVDSRLERIVKTLEEDDFEVQTIEWNKRSLDFPPKNKICGKRHIYDEPLSVYRGLSSYFLVLKWFTFVLKHARRERCSLIYACDLDAALPIFFLRIFRRGPFVFDQFDIYYDRFNRRSFRFIVQSLEKLVAQSAHLVIVPSIERLEETFCNTSVVRNLPMEQLEIDANFLRPFTLFYGGVLLPDRNLETIMRVVSMQSKWTLVVAGYGPLAQYVSDFSSASDKIRFLGPLSHIDLLQEMKSAGLVIATYDPRIKSNILTASNKLNEAVSVGVPLLASRGTAVGAQVSQNHLGYVVDYGSEEELKKLLDLISPAIPMRIQEGMYSWGAQNRWSSERKILLDSIWGVINE